MFAINYTRGKSYMWMALKKNYCTLLQTNDRNSSSSIESGTAKSSNPVALTGNDKCLILFRLRLGRHYVLFLSFINIWQLPAVACAVGTYLDTASDTCKPCPSGTYQSESGQLQCTACPAIAGQTGVTQTTGARSAADCKGKPWS